MGVLVPLHRMAVIIPAGFGDSTPGTEDWEMAVKPIRGKDVGVYALTPLGPVSEVYARRNPFLFGFDIRSRLVQRESVLRIATWVALYAPRYEQVLLVSRGPLMRVWSEAVRGLPEAISIEILPLRRGRVGLRDRVFSRRLARRVAR